MHGRSDASASRNKKDLNGARDLCVIVYLENQSFTAKRCTESGKYIVFILCRFGQIIFQLLISL